MKKLVVSLILATVGFAPAFANEAAATKIEPQKSEEMPAAPEEKKDNATIVLTVCGQCSADTMDKQEIQKEEPTAKPETAPKIS